MRLEDLEMQDATEVIFLGRFSTSNNMGLRLKPPTLTLLKMEDAATTAVQLSQKCQATRLSRPTATLL